jgi:hypothetical protein
LIVQIIPHFFIMVFFFDDFFVGLKIIVPFVFEWNVGLNEPMVRGILRIKLVGDFRMDKTLTDCWYRGYGHAVLLLNQLVTFRC